jgi:MFS family permease
VRKRKEWNKGDGVASERVTFGDVLRVREFRILWLADAQSMAGDQLARVALSVLVFDRTGSSALTALTYALTFLPALLGGALLSGLADRLPRRRVMIVCDLIRAVLLALMALPGLGLPVLAVLLVLAVLVGSPFGAAESALVPQILDGEQYVVGTGLRTITGQLAQLAGFAGGGLVIAEISARGGLALDAATFALSAALITIGVRPRPATGPRSADKGDGEGLSYAQSIAAGARLVATDPRLRTLLGLAWLAGLYVVPEAVAAPYALDLDGGPRAVGLLMASIPTGTALGTYLFVRFVAPERRALWIGPLAAGVGVPLVLCAFAPDLRWSLLLWGASGLFAAYQIQVIAEFVQAVPDEQRGQAIGIASSGLLAVQGIGVLLGGVAAGVWGAPAAVAIAGGLEALCAVGLGVSWIRIVSRQSDEETLLGRGDAGHRHPV